MTWLEYLGLEYLLSDKDFGEGISFGGLAFLVGGGCWLLLLFFRPALVNQGVVVFDLFIAVALVILTIIKFIKAYKMNEKTMVRNVFYIASIAVIVISFIYGLTKTYHALIFDYEYKKGVYSAIATTLYPTLILNFLFPFFCENSTFGNKLQECFETVGLFFILVVVFFFIGQVVTLGLSFGGEEDFYKKFISYHDREITNQRKNWEYKSAEECINAILPASAQELVNNTKDKTEKAILNNIHENYPYSELKSNNIVFVNKKWEDDYVVVYMLRDKEYNNLYYVRFNYKDYTILGYVDKAYYDNVKKAE